MIFNDNKKAGIRWRLVSMISVLVFLFFLVVGIPPTIKELSAQVKEKVGIDTSGTLNINQGKIDCQKLSEAECSGTRGVCISNYENDKFSKCTSCPKTCKETKDKILCPQLAELCNIQCGWKGGFFFGGNCEPA